MSLTPMEDIIEAAVTDAQEPVTEPESSSTVVEEIASPEATEAPLEALPDDSGEVESPAVKPVAEEDKFAKEHGISPQMVSGRENRIPYSRVKAIVSKAEQKAITPLQAKLTELEPKVAQYEQRLQQVAQFEKVLEHEPQKFLQMLSTLPAYKEFFTAVATAVDAAQRATGGQPSIPQQAPVDDMPQPDQKLSDGSMVYSMEGLKVLNTWNREQARKETISEVEKRYAPIEQAWKAQEYMNQVIPQIQQQIDVARQWPQFVENEAEITKALQADPKLSLEGAYRQVVIPKMATTKDQMREALLKEIKAAPPAKSTSVPTGGLRTSPVKSGPRDIEDVIRESLGNLGR